MQIFPSIQDKLCNLQTILSETLPSETQDFKPVLSYIFQQPGKLLRPRLILCLANLLQTEEQLNNKELQDNILSLAILTELMHTASLLHDDVIDNADTRRGQPTVSKQFSDKLAIITGDYLFAQSSLLLSKININAVGSAYAGLLASLCTGEIRQSNECHRLDLLNWENYYLRIKCKTAAMFEVACASIGHILSLSKDDIDKLQAYGIEIGIAFQLTDDVIDYTSSDQTLGKTQFKDLQNGIYTLPILLSLEKNNNQYKQHITDLIINNQFVELNQLLKDLSIFTESINIINSHLDKADEYIQSFEKKSKFCNDLLDFHQFISKRQY